MEAVLWYVLSGTRGGPNRVAILRALREQPRNPNQLADALDLNYDTIRHHLDVLADNGVVRSSGDEYGAVYLPSDTVRENWETVETITEQLEQ
ncbi:ArsR family transcriptional regulator [Halorubrum sp. ASP1]|jgi:DNA-binding transcriptional ArsR family regulator|uniref:winged helix-turn-helix domain-containing protein n=1 Tax=unclassified Halorubrum TaxID=2642239 RepID=UPI0010F6B065|nr:MULTISPECIES: winged helix-turn-helix domain-containing protein [unclassified Halorubrum]TKX49064.1 ArsR family transcriptional regulator [Halorubrum sp. ASP121]TKX62940.1 ArsR family transcriptional regulator [Halorubrum sp. ASP1]